MFAREPRGGLGPAVGLRVLPDREGGEGVGRGWKPLVLDIIHFPSALELLPVLKVLVE